MLFTCLQCQTICRMSVSIFRDTDDTSRNSTLIFVLCSKVSSRRSAVEHRNTETLAASEYDVCTPFSRRSQQDQTHQVGSNGYFCSVFLGAADEFPVIFNRTICIRILYDCTEYFRSKGESLIVAGHDLHPLRNGTGMNDGQSRSKYLLIYKQYVCTGFNLGTTTCTEEHRSCFGCGCCFVE